MGVTKTASRLLAETIGGGPGSGTVPLTLEDLLTLEVRGATVAACLGCLWQDQVLALCLEGRLSLRAWCALGSEPELAAYSLAPRVVKGIVTASASDHGDLAL